MTVQIAQEHIADLQRTAAARRRGSEVVEESRGAPVIALRVAGPYEVAELEWLAALDSARPLIGEALVALVDGRLVAAIALNDGRIIADPLVATSETRELLQTRASQLGVASRRPRWRLRPRFA